MEIRKNLLIGNKPAKDVEGSHLLKCVAMLQEGRRQRWKGFPEVLCPALDCFDIEQVTCLRPQSRLVTVRTPSL